MKALSTSHPSVVLLRRETQIALLSRPRQEAIICALLNLLFFSFNQPSPPPEKHWRAKWGLVNFTALIWKCACVHWKSSQLHKSFIQCVSTAQWPAIQTNNEETFANAFPRRQIAAAKCQSPVLVQRPSESLLSLNQDSSRIEYQMQWDTWTWTIALDYLPPLFSALCVLSGLQACFPPSQVEDVVDMTLRSVAE